MKSHMISFSWLYSVYRVLSRIYRLGEKSRVAEGYEFPRGIRGDVPPGNFFKWICAEPEMQFGASWATILRDVTVCALTWSEFFSDIVTYRLWWCVKKNVSQASYQSLQTTITEQVCKNHNLYAIQSSSSLSIRSSFCSVALSFIPSPFCEQLFFINVSFNLLAVSNGWILINFAVAQLL